jgi:imidazolonepropionase-like amidohydrolase
MTDTVLPGFLDAHVHLALVDPVALPDGGIARVLDLGGWPPHPDTAPDAASDSSASAPVPIATRAAADAGLDVTFAGQFLTAPGGYPSMQGWAPAGSVCEVGTVTDAVAAVDAQCRAGASVIKVMLNSDAGPLLDPDVLQAIVHRAHECDTWVVAHAEGVGQALRAFAAGADLLAHTPFSERIVDELIDAMAGRMTWISTLDIHGWGDYDDDFTRASDNLRRFHAHGGRVLYGTDLGNGPLPLGVNRREIDALLAAGLSPDEVLGALTARAPTRPRTGSRLPPAGRIGSRVTLISGEAPADPVGFADWLCTARAVPRAEIEERG